MQLTQDTPQAEQRENPLLSPVGFARVVLKLPLYDWQAQVLDWYDINAGETVRGTLRTPNGSGKSAVVIPALVLWWLSIFPRGKVVITTKDGKQLDGQLQPAIRKHQAKFAGWTFVDREIRTPTGARCVMFTTDEAGRAEGWHKENDDDGPLLMICDEAKSIPEPIFEAIDRCTYNAILLTSSPGLMTGTFYYSQIRPDLGYKQMAVGLADCPHIPQDRINQIIKKHGEKSPFTQSTLYGKFMKADERSVFDSEGMDRIEALVEKAEKPVRDISGRIVQTGKVGYLIRAAIGVVFVEDAESGWLTIWEPPTAGFSYISSLDTCRHEQAEAAKDPDAHSFWMLRAQFIDQSGAFHNARAACRIRHPCRWGAALIAEKIDLVLRWYGNPMIVPEVNQGLDVLNELRKLGCIIFKRPVFDRLNPGKTMEIIGWETTAKTRPIAVDAIVDAVREQAIDIECPVALQQIRAFIRDKTGKACAAAGEHDDDVMALGIGLACMEAGKMKFVPQVDTVDISRGIETIVADRYERLGGGAMS